MGAILRARPGIASVDSSQCGIDPLFYRQPNSGLRCFSKLYEATHLSESESDAEEELDALRRRKLASRSSVFLRRWRAYRALALFSGVAGSTENVKCQHDSKLASDACLYKALFRTYMLEATRNVD